MDFKMKMGLSQKMGLSPQMLQSIRLLSLSVADLEKTIQSELEENPVLEEKGEVSEDQTTLEEQEFENLNWTQYTSTDAYVRGDKDSAAPSQEEDREGKKYDANADVIQESLKDHLVWQISLSGFTEEERKILNHIVSEIDDEGYLKESTKNIAKANNVSSAKVEALLQKLQEFDPPGVGARNLKECLRIQAQRLEEDTTDLMSMIDNHLEDLRTKNYKKIAQALNIQIEEVEDLAGIITSMEPQPGRLFTSHKTHYVIPDIYISKNNAGGYSIGINEDGIPHIQVAAHYTKFLNQMIESRKKENKATKQYLSEKMRRALYFIRSLNQRRSTLLNLAQMIAEEQQAFLDKGEKFLRPILLKEAADRLGLHVSSISRLASNKFVRTPQGVFELKYFFGVSYLNQKGERVSGEVISSIVKDCIDKEDKKNPISDEKISQIILEKEGVQLSRRQVTRFREQLGYQNTRLRKH